MGIETAALIVTALAATTSAAVGYENYEAGKSAAGAAKNLADQQAAQLQSEQQAQEALAAKEAATGSSFGFANENPDALKSGFGFSAAPAPSPNSGRGQITGMG